MDRRIIITDSLLEKSFEFEGNDRNDLTSLNQIFGMFDSFEETVSASIEQPLLLNLPAKTLTPQTEASAPPVWRSWQLHKEDPRSIPNTRFSGSQKTFAGKQLDFDSPEFKRILEKRRSNLVIKPREQKFHEISGEDGEALTQNSTLKDRK